MSKTPETLDELFESATPKNDYVENAIEDDFEDFVRDHLEENRKISIFDSEYVLEGEM